MSSCIICGRTRNGKAKSTNITFHRFPLEDTYKNKWYNVLQENGIIPEKVSKTSLVCSLHFDNSFFVMGKGRRLLLKNAVPSKIMNEIKCCPWSNKGIEGVSSLDEPVKSSSNESRREEEGILSLENSSVSIIDSETVIPNTNILNILDLSTMSIDTKMVSDEMPHHIALKRNLHQLSHEESIKNIKMKILHQKIRCRSKRISSMKNIISELQKQI